MTEVYMKHRAHSMLRKRNHVISIDEFRFGFWYNASTMYMAYMAGFNFSTIGKIFADTFHFNLATSGLFLGFQSGQQVHGFVIPLPLAKLMRDALDKAIKEFEAKNGQIDTKGGATGILSDIQPR